MNKYTCTIWRNGELAGFLGTNTLPVVGQVINVPGHDDDCDDELPVKAVELRGHNAIGQQMVELDVVDE